MSPLDALARPAAPAHFTIAPHGRTMQVPDSPVSRAAAAEFCSGFEEGTLQFFDAVLPGCRQMIDFGAFIGFTALYAASSVPAVHGFEPSPQNIALLEANLAANPGLAARIRLHRHAVGARDAILPLYAKGHVDSGSSLFRDVERAAVVRGVKLASVPVRAAGPVLDALGLDDETLLKIDIEGAEYDLLPAITERLAVARPHLHISFHPYNIVLGRDEYLNQITRLRRALQVAEAVEPYRFMYFHTEQGWVRMDRGDRALLLGGYLLRAKPVPRIATAQYGFTDALALSDTELPLG